MHSAGFFTHQTYVYGYMHDTLLCISESDIIVDL